MEALIGFAPIIYLWLIGTFFTLFPIKPGLLYPFIGLLGLIGFIQLFSCVLKEAPLKHPVVCFSLIGSGCAVCLVIANRYSGVNILDLWNFVFFAPIIISLHFIWLYKKMTDRIKKIK